MDSRFAEELAGVLPEDLPNRQTLIAKSAQHMEMIVAANQQFNLTRITAAREAAIKHVLDSVFAWRHFAAGKHVLDAGSGAGFPGLPLSLVLPDLRFTLAESTQKRARFLEHAVDALDIANVDVVAERAEVVLRQRPTIRVITARALAPLSRIIPLFAPAFKRGVKALLLKGPDVEAEMLEAIGEARRLKVAMRIVEKYELPEEMGGRTIVEISA